VEEPEYVVEVFGDALFEGIVVEVYTACLSDQVTGSFFI
jgi:hypothetical protein